MKIKISDLKKRVTEAFETDDERDGIVLAGPFSASPREHGDHSLFISDVVIDNDQFNEIIAKRDGMSLEDAREVTDHEINVEVTWSFSKAEPSVGWGGGYEMEDYEVVGVDGVALMNPEDRTRLGKMLKHQIKDVRDRWAQEAEERAEEARADAVISSYDYDD